jgi:chromate transporter
MAIGLMRAGYGGALAAWLGFTMPSAILLIGLALGLSHYGLLPGGLLHGLKLAAVAVVAQAVWAMARSLCPDAPRVLLMLATAAVMLWSPAAWVQLVVIAAGGLAGALWLHGAQTTPHEPMTVPVSRRAGVVWLLLFFVLLAGLPLLAGLTGSHLAALANAFYRSGSLVFGGGHVVLPLLQAAVVAPGWVDADTFLAGYGAAQAVPGPLFTFAAYLGAAMRLPPAGWAGGLFCLVAIFVPAFLLVAGALPFWDQLRRNARARAGLAGVNAVVVGVLLAALYRPVWVSTVASAADVAVVIVALLALLRTRVPGWAIVLVLGLGGWLLG